MLSSKTNDKAKGIRAFVHKTELFWNTFVAFWLDDSNEGTSH